MNNSPPNGAKDVKKFYAENIPTKLKDFDVRKLDGKWYKVRGYNPKYDCYPCQTNTFKYNPTTNKMETEVKLRVANLGKNVSFKYFTVLACTGHAFCCESLLLTEELGGREGM